MHKEQIYKNNRKSEILVERARLLKGRKRKRFQCIAIKIKFQEILTFVYFLHINNNKYSLHVISMYIRKA